MRHFKPDWQGWSPAERITAVILQGAFARRWPVTATEWRAASEKRRTS